MKEKTFLSKRAWLNSKDHDDTGMFAAHVSVDEMMIDAYLEVWDCSRKISLNFAIFEEEEAAQRAKKIDMLIGSLQEMKQALGKAYVYYVDNKDDGDE